MKKNDFLNNGMIDLAQPRLGSKIVYKTDDFFGPVERLISSGEPIWKEGIYDENGKWMDGWETRRRRNKEHDYLILHLGREGSISKININTTFFNGNQPQFASIEGCNSKNLIPNSKTKWKLILKKTKLLANKKNLYKSKDNKSVFTHIKFNIYPDGGVARLRLYGKIATDRINYSKNNLIELSSMLNGSSIIYVNNEHFGKAENVLAPSKATNMSDGWETRRRRNKGNDWLIFKLGLTGIINQVIVDTSHFKGNYPDRFSLQGAFINKSNLKSKNNILNQSIKWKYLINKSKLGPDNQYYFDNILIKSKINYVRLNIYPDGGIARINIFGKIK